MVKTLRRGNEIAWKMTTGRKVSLKIYKRFNGFAPDIFEGDYGCGNQLLMQGKGMA